MAKETVIIRIARDPVMNLNTIIMTDEALSGFQQIVEEGALINGANIKWEEYEKRCKNKR